MLATRGVWAKTLAILAIPLVALGTVLALGAKDRIERAEAASDTLDGIYPFATVAAMEGALHEEGSLAIALAVGLIEADEFATATAATDAARVELIDELTYHEPDSELGRTLGAIEAGMGSIEETRGQLLAGTFEGQASAPYRALLVATGEASRASIAVLAPVTIGAPPLAALDAARSASGEAVFEGTASIFEASGTAAVTSALSDLDAAHAVLGRTGSVDLVSAVDTALASPDATLAAEGTAMLAAGEVPDLLAWADAAPAWVLAYGDPESAEIEASIAIMETDAKRAEDAALEFVLVGAAAWLGIAILSLLVTRSALSDRSTVGDRRSAAAVVAATEVSSLSS